MKKTLLTSFALAVLISGCATMSPEQCMVADWYRLGEQDALAGRTSDHLANRAGACQEAGYGVDTESWYAGFEAALPSFCTIDSGFQFGVNGSRYQNSCPVQFADEFIDGYQLGSEIYALQQSTLAAQRRMDQTRNLIDREMRQEQPDLDRIDDLQDDLDDIMRDLRALESELGTVRGVAIGRGFSVPR